MVLRWCTLHLCIESAKNCKTNEIGTFVTLRRVYFRSSLKPSGNALARSVIATTSKTCFTVVLGLQVIFDWTHAQTNS
jgi:hypothetical protein